MIDSYRPRDVLRVSIIGCMLLSSLVAMTPAAQAYDGELDPDFAAEGIMPIAMGTWDGAGKGVSANQSKARAVPSITSRQY